MAMTFDPANAELTVYLDGAATPTSITDPVAQNVFKYKESVAGNPYRFPWPIYSPRSFVLKFNGYDVESSGVYEHWLQVDADKNAITYGRSVPDPTKVQEEYQVTFDVQREDKSLLAQPLVIIAENGNRIGLPNDIKIGVGDVIVTSLQVRQAGKWRQVGTEIQYPIREGAPFTFGRALGLGAESIDHGTQLFIDGAAVFNRVLSREELRALSFQDR